MNPNLTLSLLNETETDWEDFEVVAVRSAAKGELLANLDDGCVTVAGNRVGGLQVIVVRIEAGELEP